MSITFETEEEFENAVMEVIAERLKISVNSYKYRECIEVKLLDNLSDTPISISADSI